MSRPGVDTVLSQLVWVLASGLIAGALGPGAFAAASPRADASVPAGAPTAGDDFFASPALRVFQIELSEAAMASLGQHSNSYVRGTVREGAQVFTHAGIHRHTPTTTVSITTRPRVGAGWCSSRTGWTRPSALPTCR